MQTETRQGSPLESLKITPFTLTGAGLARWRLPVRLLLVCLLLVGLWNWVGQEPQRQWQPGAPIHVVAGGRHYRVSPDEMSALQAYSATYFQERAEEGQARLQGSTGAHLEQLFARVEGQLPGFLDWYYSLPGEYSRIGMGLASLLGWHEGDYVRDRAARMLFHETNWQGSLMRLETGARAQLAQYDAITREGWLAGIMERLEPHQVPAPLPSANSAESSDRARLSIDALEQQLADVSLLSLDERLAISTGGAVAGVALWRGAARAATTRGGRQAAARGAGRGMARAGSAAAGGGVACAPGGPVALGCAVVAGTVAWLTFDWALLKAEEALRRDHMEAALKISLQELRSQVEGDIQSALAANISRHQQFRQDRISGHFMPMQGRIQE